MRLTNRSEYALLALVYMGRKPFGEVVQGDEIVKAQKIPKRFLQQILHSLKRSRLIKSTRGKSGGYSLAKPADKTSIAEIVRVFEGALAPTNSVSEFYYEPTPLERESGLISLMRDVRRLVVSKLESTTLKDVINLS